MHGCSSGSGLLVNAEVDSMGGVVDGGVGTGIKTSPRRAAIEKAQAELRQEYDVREERRRELEFLEKGGNPLDFKFGNAASVSVQSTSFTDHHTEHFVTCEAKGSFALTASPHGDSVESSGRPGIPTICEPNSADNFHGENDLLEGERKVKHSTRRNKIVPSEQSSEMDGAQNPKESEDSAIFHSYARRNRSRPNRDAARSSSTDVVQSSVGHGSSLPVRGGSRDVKGSVSETKSPKEHTTPSTSIPKSTFNGDVLPRIESSTTPSNMESDDLQLPEEKENLPNDGQPGDRLEGFTEGNNLLDSQSVQPVQGDSQKIRMDVGSEACDHAVGQEHVSADPEAVPNSVTKEFDNKTSSVQLNGFSDTKVDENEGQNVIATTRTKVLDSELLCTQNRPRVGANNGLGLCVTQFSEASDVILTKLTPQCEGRNTTACTEEHQKGETMAGGSCTVVSDDRSLVNQNPSSNASVLKTDEDNCPNIEETKQNDDDVPEVDKKVGNSIDGESSLNREHIFPAESQASSDKHVQEELPVTILSEKNSTSSDPQLCPGSPSKTAGKAREDSILEEARIIEAKRKRIAELSVGTIQQESRPKTHWDFVLEEMAWLAYDFSQERLWKMTAAAQICHRVALLSRLRVEEQNQVRKLKRVAYTLAKAVMQFWNSAEVLLNCEDQSSSVKDYNHDSRRLDCREFFDKFGEHDKETCNKLESQNPGKSFGGVLHGYAVRFLKFNNSQVPPVQAEAPATPDRITDLGIVDTSWDDSLTEESLFYAVPSGAMETYRASIESHLAQFEKTGSSIQEDVDTSMYDTAAEIGYHENIYDEEEGETSTYYLPGAYELSKSTKHDQKKRKVFVKSYSGRSYEADLPYGHPVVSQQHTLMGKRSGNNLHVGSIPTKRTRTAAVVRQRVISPFGGSGTPVPQPAPMKTDASSGDTSSFQDDQSTLHGGFQVQKSLEVESAADFERQLPYDCAETSAKPKKKKKSKHLGSSYDPVWQLDSIVNNEQRDNLRKRVESHHFDSNGTSGIYVQHAAKKPKIVKQSLDNSFENLSGSIPSPVTSQMSNMSNTNRFMKIINGQKGRKNKSLKVSPVQLGSGSPWSLFEDQALVVLVHDMGPNWELVSDAINSTLQFKCIFRKPQECKDRYKVLMDKGAGDGADSADDSGSSQSYPSTLPGIPKGSARQLFQRLQGPMLEETLKSHFEKIIMIGKKQLYRRNQNDNQDAKQLAAVHNSHVVALSQVCPNNLNGSLLTPLDLCDASASSPDVLPLGYQGSHGGGLPMPNQGAVACMVPSTGANSLLGSSGMVLSNNCTSPSGSHTAPVRDGRYCVPRASLPADEQQRMQHYNQMLSGRNMQQSNSSVSSPLAGSDRRMLPGGNGIGMMPGVNRNTPLSRPVYQGMASSSMLNAGTMLSSSMVGMPSPVNMHSGTASAQGNSLMRPREALHMMRPGHNPEHQRQLAVPEMQMQVSPGNSPGIPGFNGLSSGFANQTNSPPVPGYPGHLQQHQMSAQQPHVLNNPHHPHLQGPNQVAGPQQAYAMRLAKERQMQQRLLQQQQQQLAASSALMPHVQPQSQLPTSSSVQTSTQIQPPSSQSSPMPALTPVSMQQQQKHNLPHHGLNRNSQASVTGLNNQTVKQRQRQLPQQQQQQQFQQSGRHHPQQRQHSQPPQQAKLVKGMGRGNMVMHQNLPMDPSQRNGLSVPSGNQSVEKGEQVMHLVQGQGLYPGTGLSPMQPSKPLVPQSSNHSQQQPKVFSGSSIPPSKQQQIPSHSDDSAQGQVHPASSGHGLGATHQPVSSTMVSNHQHLQPESQQKQVSQSQPTVQRIPQLNRQLPSDMPAKSQNDQGLTDQQPLNNVTQLASSLTAAMPHACIDSVSAVPAVSSAANSQWKQSESVYDSGSANSVMRAASTGSESVLSGSQGLGPRQLSGGLAQHCHISGSQWQQQPHQSKIPQASPQQFRPQEQQLQEQDRSPRLPLQQQSQQQAHLQTAQGSAYIRPTNSKTD